MLQFLLITHSPATRRGVFSLTHSTHSLNMLLAGYPPDTAIPYTTVSSGNGIGGTLGHYQLGDCIGRLDAVASDHLHAVMTSVPCMLHAPHPLHPSHARLQ